MGTWPEDPAGNDAMFQPDAWSQPGTAQDRVRFQPPPQAAPPPGWAQAAPGLAQPMPGWAQPYPGIAVPQQASNKVAVAGMILGITSIVFFWLGLLSLTQDALAIVLGAMGLNRANLTGIGRGEAIAGIVCGGVGFLLYIIFGVITLGIGLFI
jgi:hypothetical protein